MDSSAAFEKIQTNQLKFFVKNKKEKLTFIASSYIDRACSSFFPDKTQLFNKYS
jgi:hypothetical protein